MGASLERGQSGEALAERYLIEQGLTILERGWRKGALEIDLIALEQDELVMVEVKTRSGMGAYGSAVSSVDRKKQRNMIRAANAYLETNELSLSVRYDIVAIELMPTDDQARLEHIRSAFYPSLAL